MLQDFLTKLNNSAAITLRVGATNKNDSISFISAAGVEYLGLNAKDRVGVGIYDNKVIITKFDGAGSCAINKGTFGNRQFVKDMAAKGIAAGTVLNLLSAEEDGVKYLYAELG